MLSEFDSAYKNDTTGRPGIDPRTLLKLVLYGYSRGKQSSRKIEQLSKNNIIAKALTADIEADHTTIADFVSGNSEKLKKVFTCVLIVCDELRLIGGEKFAIDRRRLSSNAAKETNERKERMGVSGKEIQSNVTDNESAKIKGPHGVVQGYTGIAAADSKAQVA